MPEMLLLAPWLFWAGIMNNRQRRSRIGRQQPKNQSTRGAAPPAPTSLIPPDLCAPSLIQNSYGRLNRVSHQFGAPLLPVSEPKTSPAALAVDALVHLTEGWRYLSSALSSMLDNAPSQTIHFAYYAELRSAMSLLSSYGIRVGNEDNSYVNKSGDKKVASAWKNMRTHTAVWKLWEAWATTPEAEALILDQLKILPSITIGKLKASVGRIAVNPTLTHWAIDLKVGNEHTARNRASYRTIMARAPFEKMQVSDFEFVRDLWALAEPTGFGLRFEQELVRYLVDAELNDQDFGNDEAARAAWRQRLITDLERTTGTPISTLEAFFDGNESLSPLFNLAFASDVKPVNIVARAFFMLRLATLKLNGALASHPASPAKAWLEDWLQHAGLFDPSDQTRPDEKWIDFEHLSQVATPPMPFPFQLNSTSSRCLDTYLLCRVDALLAWSASL